MPSNDAVITAKGLRSGTGVRDPLEVGAAVNPVSGEQAVPVQKATRHTLEVRDAVKRYGDVVALKSVSLAIRPGEFMTLLGPSGSGKTTLLNVIAGFESLDEGELSYGGKSLVRVPPEKRQFGFVFQSYALFPHMTVEENVAYPLRIRGVPKAERIARVAETLELVELTQLGGRLPVQLSGGQQQRVALARALVFRPDVLLMDEPLSALDRQLRHSLQFELKKLHERLTATIVYVTHDQEEALTMSDRIAVMRGGEIEQIADPQTLYRRPASTFVAAFLGENNFIPGVLRAAASSTTECTVDLVGLQSTVGIQRDCVIAGVNDGDVVLSVRPEDVHLEAPTASHLGNRVPATVVARAFLGDSWRYECRAGDGQKILVKTAAAEPQFAAEDSVNLVIDPRAVSVFEK